MATAVDRTSILGPFRSPAADPLAERQLAGRVAAVTGSVIVLKLDGARLPVKSGGEIFETDIVLTEAGASVTIDMGSTMVALGGDARMLVESGGSQPVFFVLQGQFAVQPNPVGSDASGPVAVRTPVSNLVLRNGRMVGSAAAEAVSNSFVMLPNRDGSSGLIAVTTVAGTVLLERAMQGTTVVSLFRAPLPVIERDLSGLQLEFGNAFGAWLPTTMRPSSFWFGPESLYALLGSAMDAFGLRAARLIDLLLPSAAAAGAVAPASGGSAPVLPSGSRGGVDQTAPLSPLSPPPPQLPPPDQPPAVPNVPQRVTLSISPGTTSIVGGTAVDTVSLLADPVQSNTLSIVADALNRVVITDGAGNIVVLAGIEELDLTLGTGNDLIVLGDLTNTQIADSTVTIHAGAGNDTIDGSLAGKRLVLFGEDGNDLLIGSSKADDLFGGAGDDILIGGSGNDLLDGGGGNDTVRFANATSGVTASLASGSAMGNGNDSLIGIENLEGSPFADMLTGDGGANRLDGAGGDDTLDGGGGDDTLIGGAGRDAASFAQSATGVVASLVAGIATGNGNDSLSEIEDLIGSDFADTLTGSIGSNVIAGGAGDDLINALGGSDTVTGGSGNDTVDAAVSGSVHLLKNGNDVVVTSGGGSASVGTTELLRLTGSGADDSFTLGNLAGTVDALEINGGGGFDTAIFTAVPGGVEVDLATGTVDANGNFTITLQSIESVVGSDQRDTLLGSAGADVLAGGQQADTLDGRGGDDRFVYNAGDGDEAIEGGLGNDTVDVNFGTATVELSTVASQLRVDVALQGPDDRLTVANTETVRLFASGGNDTITIGGNGSTIELGNLAGSGVVAGGVQVFGGAGNDQLNASGVTQALVLAGGAGADTLQGSAGVLQGFRYDGAGDGGDTIVAFESGTDRVQVSGSGFGVTSITQGQNFFAATLGSGLGVSAPAFIFEAASGRLAYDSDGDGGAAFVVLATLQAGTIQAADMQVF
jgi:Ca2+-binding RTX toxin-like protein